MKLKTIYNSVPIILGIISILFLIFAFYALYLEHQHSTFCEEKGYDYYDGFERAKSGYIVCCNHIYNNNIRIGGSCEGIREEGVRG